MWTAAHGQILTLDSYMLCGRPLANCCCMCCCNEESMDHLLIFCPLANTMWIMLQLFGIDWVMPGSVVDWLCCWHHWLGKYNFDIWYLVEGCLMWTLWVESNRRSIENFEKSLSQLLDLCQRTLFDWSQCRGLLDCSNIIDFLLSLRIGFWFLYFFMFLCCLLSWTLVYLFFLSIYNITLLPIKRKKKKIVIGDVAHLKAFILESGKNVWLL